MRKTAIALALSLFLCLTSAVALGLQADGTPPFFQQMGISGLCADDAYLYVMAGGKIMQYSFDLALQNSVNLPDPVSAPGAPPLTPAEAGAFPPPPPMGGPPHGIRAAGGFLYVMAGPELHKYAIPGLVLLATVELPRPEFTPSGN